MDFYEHLSSMENEAMRRARTIREAEAQAAQHYRGTQAPPPKPPPMPAHHLTPPPPLGGFGSLFSGKLFPAKPFAGGDLSTIMMLFFILNSEQSDPLLTLALLYILM